MASLQKTYSGDLSTSIARQLWTARNIAAAAKGEADQIIGPNVDNNMLRPGEFMSRALQMRATSMLPKRFQRQMPDLMGSDYLLRGQSRSFASPINPQFTNNQAGARAAGQPFPWLAVGAPLSAQRKPASPSVLSQASKTSGTPTTTNTKTREKGVVVKDQQLGNFLAAVALSLSSSFNSINKKLDEANEGIIVAKDGIADTHKKLEHHSDSLESKLDDIIDALRFANIEEKVQKDQRQAASKKAEVRKATDLSTAKGILMQGMDKEEIRQMQMEDIAEDDRGPIGDPWEDPKEQQLNIPELEEGGVASGPDSGYLAVLHGDEAVIPLDNNYTQGETSALTNPVTPNTPMASNTMPMMERGNNLDSMNPKMLPWKGLSRPSISSSTNVNVEGSSVGGTDLAAAIQLPSKAAGIVTMGLMGEVLKNAKLPPGVTTHIKNISSPIASAFGISDVMSEDLTEDSEFIQNQKRQEVLSARRGREGRERGVFGKIMDFIRGKRGTGGGNVIYNRTSGGTGGGYGTGGIFGGKKGGKNIIDKMKFDPENPDRENPHPPGTMLYNIWNQRKQQYQMMKEAGMISSAGGNEFFTKNLSYENAYDYRKFDSPEYGLRTSEVAYNMSMDDEVNAIAEGMSDPSKSEIIAHNQTALNTNEKQMEISPITNRGNPLKDGIYLGAYSV